MKNLGGVIELINASKSAEEAFQHFYAAMAEYGYERVVYSLVTDHPSLSLPKQHGLATSYPEHWMKYYIEKNYIAIDPVFTGALKSRAPFFWADLKNDPEIPESAFKVLDQGAEAGLKDGIGIPLFGKNGEITGVGLARAESEKGKDYQFMANAYLLSTYFHEKYRSLIQPSVISKITQKERDIIAWAAEGKTDEEIAMILNLSAHTVRWHWKKIFTKLDARGRLYAITKAISMGLVTPVRIRTPKSGSCPARAHGLQSCLSFLQTRKTGDMKAKSKTLKTNKNKTDEMRDGAEFLDCVKFLHAEAQRLGYLKLAKILEHAVGNCAKVLNARDEK